MTRKARVTLKESQVGSYFTSEKPDIQFVSSGCTVLDCALGGGWALSRVANIVGDRSTAKTALATEALTNFTIEYPNGKAAYRECEAAFDRSYAAAMGLPIDKIDFGNEDEPLTTVEDFVRDFATFLEGRAKADEPGIYVLDSLDALSDEAELDRDIEKGTYGMEKAKLLSRFFRTAARDIEKSKVLLLIVSQVRDNIGVTFGEKNKRSGGRALDFYASQVLWLARTKTLKRSINKIERAYGVSILGQVKKNKVGLPFREASLDFIFGYGTEDLTASVDWLDTIGKWGLITDLEEKDYIKKLDAMTEQEYREERFRLREIVKAAWAEVEQGFLPKRAKYGG